MTAGQQSRILCGPVPDCVPGLLRLASIASPADRLFGTVNDLARRHAQPCPTDFFRFLRSHPDRHPPCGIGRPYCTHRDAVGPNLRVVAVGRLEHRPNHVGRRQGIAWNAYGRVRPWPWAARWHPLSLTPVARRSGAYGKCA